MLSSLVLMIFSCPHQLMASYVAMVTQTWIYCVSYYLVMVHIHITSSPLRIIGDAQCTQVTHQVSPHQYISCMYSCTHGGQSMFASTRVCMNVVNREGIVTFSLILCFLYPVFNLAILSKLD